MLINQITNEGRYRVNFGATKSDLPYQCHCEKCFHQFTGVIATQNIAIKIIEIEMKKYFLKLLLFINVVILYISSPL